MKYFIVAGWRLLLLRPSDHDPVTRVVLGTFFAGQVTHAANGEEVLVPANITPFIQ